MDSIGDYIWLVLAALYFFFGRKKKKESPKPTKRQRSPQNKSTLEDILRELSGEAKEVEPAPVEPVYEPPVEYQTEPEPIKDNTARYVNPELEIYSDDIEHKADTGDAMAGIRAQLENEKNLRTGAEEKQIDFDLRKAMIYDVILRRPYD